MNLLSLLVTLAASSSVPQAQPATPPKIEVVATMGCLKQAATGNDWMLVNATDPTPSRAGAPTADQLPKEPVAGKNQFKLIGIAEFNLQDKKDKAVVVKGLYLKDKPVSRLNITSVTVVAGTCPPTK